MANEWTVPEAGEIEVLFRYMDNGQKVTRGFRIPPYIARALNQFCVDNNRLTEAGQPDTLGLFASSAYGTVKQPGLVLTILDRYKDYPGMQSAELAEAKAKADAAAAELAAAMAAAAAAGLQPVEEIEGEPIA